MNPPLVSTCVYTRIQNCTSGSSSGGRGISTSAASTRATRHHSTTSHPSRVALAPHVEFIYTPTVPNFDCVFNKLHVVKHGPLSLDGPNPSTILTTARTGTVAPRRHGRRRLRRDGVKPSHNGQCVTVDPRRRYNMSHRKGVAAIWHARCFIYSHRDRRRSTAIEGEAS